MTCIEMFVKKVAHVGKGAVRLMVKNKKSVVKVGWSAAMRINEIKMLLTGVFCF